MDTFPLSAIFQRGTTFKLPFASIDEEAFQKRGLLLLQERIFSPKGANPFL